ncbi:MAG TPA: PIN domain-containing protein [Longimicrobiales bacterium]|nr:PIN domain-containing protein [Longimicrobiales bacterium]
MIYLDTSVALAHLLAEDREPPASLWESDLVASRLLVYELWSRIHALDLARSHGDAARGLLARIGLLDLAPAVLERARQPFPTAVRTLDALHLASVAFLVDRGHEVALASYDTRMCSAAAAMGIALHPLP